MNTEERMEDQLEEIRQRNHVPLCDCDQCKDIQWLVSEVDRLREWLERITTAEPTSTDDPSREAIPFTPESRRQLVEWLGGWLHRTEARPLILGLLAAHDTEQTMHAAWRERTEEAESTVDGLRSPTAEGPPQP